MAHTSYGTRYLGTDGRWNGANSLIGPWRHGHTRAGPNGGAGGFTRRIDHRIGPLHPGKPRGSGWDSGRTKLPNPRAPPMPSDAD